MGFHGLTGLQPNGAAFSTRKGGGQEVSTAARLQSPAWASVSLRMRSSSVYTAVSLHVEPYCCWEGWEGPGLLTSTGDPTPLCRGLLRKRNSALLGPESDTYFWCAFNPLSSPLLAHFWSVGLSQQVTEIIRRSKNKDKTILVAIITCQCE